MSAWGFMPQDKDMKPEYFFPRLRIICSALHNSMGAMSGSSSCTCSIETFDPQGRIIVPTRVDSFFGLF